MFTGALSAVKGSQPESAGSSVGVAQLPGVTAQRLDAALAT
jgi:hypothetical protein